MKAQMQLMPTGGISDLLYKLMANSLNIFQALSYVAAVLGASADFNRYIRSSESSLAIGGGESALAEVCCLGSTGETARPAIERASLQGHSCDPRCAVHEIIYYFVNKLISEPGGASLWMGL